MRENGDGGGGVVTDVNRQRRTNSTDCGELERRSPPSVLLLWCVRDKKGRNEHSWAKYHGVLALRLFCCALCALYAKLDPKPRENVSRYHCVVFSLAVDFLFCRSGSSRTQCHWPFNQLILYSTADTEFWNVSFFLQKLPSKRWGKTKKSQRPSLV